MSKCDRISGTVFTKVFFKGITAEASLQTPTKIQILTLYAIFNICVENIKGKIM